MPKWIVGKDGESAWAKAKNIVRKEYGAALEKSDSDRFYSLVTTVYKSICKSPDYDCGIGKAEDAGYGVGSMNQLIERLSRFINIGNPEMRAAAVYDLGTKVRNFAGELAYKLVDKNDPYGEMAANFPKVKRSGKTMIKAMQDFSKAVFDTEKSIDVTQYARGRLKEGLLDEALTVGGVKATLERAIDNARKLAGRVDKTVVAGDFKATLGKAAGDLEKIADHIHEEILAITEKSQPKLNKYDPGSLLGWCVHLLDKEGLGDAADEVRAVSRHVSKAWQGRKDG